MSSRMQLTEVRIFSVKVHLTYGFIYIILGVTVVQYRNKNGDKADMLREASNLLEITRKHNVPLIINDRVDIALAIGADGVHIGQDDLGQSKPIYLSY
jgi:thiamine-phosphate diphosphorylase